MVGVAEKSRQPSRRRTHWELHIGRFTALWDPCTGDEDELDNGEAEEEARGWSYSQEAVTP